MKTKNNVQKTIAKTLAAGMSLVLISFTVNAQDFWKSFMENSGLNNIATAMVEPAKTETYNVTNTNSSAFTEENEEPLELETWMTDENNFTTTFSIESETEAPLALENWMKNENTFNASNFVMEEESENALELESWMTSDSSFGISNLKIVDEAEQPMAMADWMTSDKIW